MGLIIRSCPGRVHYRYGFQLLHCGSGESPNGLRTWAACSVSIGPCDDPSSDFGGWRRVSSGRLPSGDASPGSLRRLCFLEVADCAFELVAATGIAEPNNMAVMFGERIGLHRLAGPRAGSIDAIGNVESAPRTLLRYYPTLNHHRGCCCTSSRSSRLNLPSRCAVAICASQLAPAPPLPKPAQLALLRA